MTKRIDLPFELTDRSCRRKFERLVRKINRLGRNNNCIFRGGNVWTTTKDLRIVLLNHTVFKSASVMELPKRCFSYRTWLCSLLKVPMKWNLVLFSIKIYLAKYAFPKFQRSGIKNNDFTSLQSLAFCLPKMVRGMGRVNPKIPLRDVTLVPNFCLHNQSFLSARSVYVRKMSSDSEMIDSSERSSNTGEGGTEEEEDEDVEIIYSQLTPCKTNLWPKLTLTTIHELQMISRKGNLMKTGLQRQLWKRDTKGKLQLTYVR